MSEPKNPQPTDGLPLDWSLSRVAPQPMPPAPKPVAPPEPPPPAPTLNLEPEPPAPTPVSEDETIRVFAPAAPEPAPAPAPTTAPAPVQAPALQLMDMNVLGAIGAWQRASPSPAPAPAPAAPSPYKVTPPSLAIPAAPVPAPAPAPAPAPLPAAKAPAAAAPVQPAQIMPEPVPVPTELRRGQPVVDQQEELEPQAELAKPAPGAGGLLHRLAFWRATTGIAALAAIVLGVVALQKPVTFEQAVAAIGVVNAPAPIYLAELGDGKLRVTPLAIVAVPAVKDLQLWMFMVDSQTPISLGVLPSTGGIFTLPQIPTEGARFVISLEPHGGTPPGKITGDVLYGGTLAKR